MSAEVLVVNYKWYFQLRNYLIIRIFWTVKIVIIGSVHYVCMGGGGSNPRSIPKNFFDPPQIGPPQIGVKLL